MRENEQEDEQLICSFTDDVDNDGEISLQQQENETINSETINSSDNNLNVFSVNRPAAKNHSKIKFLITNARSLSPKILSLIDCFDELELHFAVITESWLADSELLENDLIDLESGTDLKAVYKNRKLRPNSRRRTAGGGRCYHV